MSDFFDALNDKLIEFIGQQQLFFVGTAGAQGRVNVSPKGMDSFRIIDNSTIAWLNLTGSGNESAAQVLENGRMTIMFCSFDKQPLILRLYGLARAIHTRDAEWSESIAMFTEHSGARQVFVLDLQLVQTSCGYAVPFFDYRGERTTLEKWANNKGPEGVQRYWRENNMLSLDGKYTGIF